jgi:phosphoglycolate phosphatase
MGLRETEEEKKMGVKAFVFDMDGTILHTLPDLTVVTNRAMERMGYPLHTQEEVLTYVGNGAARLVNQACPPNASEEDRQYTLKLWQQIYLDYDNALTAPFPGIEDTLRALRARGVKTAVLSNKFDAAVRELAEQYLPGLFDIARGEIPPIPRKPDPTALLQVVEQLGSTPAETVYVGDTSVDFETARNAGTRMVGVSWGYDKALPLPIDELDGYIHEASELLDFID